LIGTSEVTLMREITWLGFSRSSVMRVISPTLMPLKCASPPTEMPRTGPAQTMS